MKEKLKPGDIGSYDVNLSIRYPKPENTYKIMIYVREKGNDKNLSIKLNKNNLQEKYYESINEIYNEFEEKYNISGLFGGEDSSKEKIRELNCDKDEIKKLIDSFTGESDY